MAFAMPGMWELLGILVLVLFLFPRRILTVSRSLGECVGLIQSVGDDDHDQP